MRTEDLLLSHPQVAHVEVEVVTGGPGADHHLPERLDHEHRGGERRLADVLEDDVGRGAQDLSDRLGEAAGLREACLFLLGALSALSHHPGVLAAVDVAGGAELRHQLALLFGGDDADAFRT